MQLSHFLFTTDFSDDSLRPLPAAAHLAKSLGAKLSVLNVIPDHTKAAHAGLFVGPIAVTCTADLKREAQSRCEKTRARLGLDPNVEFTVMSSIEVQFGVLRFAHEHGIDAIVMTSQCREGISRLLFGSVTESVMRRADLPIWVFPHDGLMQPRPIRRILMTTDLDGDTTGVLAEVASLARSLGAQLTLLNVIPMTSGATYGVSMMPTDESLQQSEGSVRAELRNIADSIPDLDIAVAAQRGESVEDAVHEFVLEHEIDLLALSTHARRGISRLVFGSVAGQIIRRSSIPVLALRHQEV